MSNKFVFSEKDILTWIEGGMTTRLHWFPFNVRVPQLSETLAGMANTKGGIILLGVSPRGGEIHGVPDTTNCYDSVFQAALMLEPSLVLPLPSSVTIGAKQVVVIQVPQGLPNVYSFQGQYLERIGQQTQKISSKRLRYLLFERGEIQFDRQVLPGADYDDLDPEQIRNYFETISLSSQLQNGNSVKSDLAEQFLQQRGCLQRIGDQLVPTYAGLLVFGNTPHQWLPSAIILASRFPGEKFSDDFIKQEIRGSLPQQLVQAEAFLRSNMRTTVHMVGLTHQEELEFPYEAVRELLVNAVVHRDYNAQGDTIHLQLFSDRLEIHSPGRLPGPVNLENLLKARYARNPVITQLMADLGYVERLGYGLDRVVSIMKEMNLPQPIFEEVAGCFVVTLRNNIGLSLRSVSSSHFSLETNFSLNPRQEVALNFLHENKRITNKDFQELCSEVHVETLRRDLADLVSKGILLKIGDKRATYYILKETKFRQSND